MYRLLQPKKKNLIQKWKLKLSQLQKPKEWATLLQRRRKERKWLTLEFVPLWDIM